MLYNIRLAQNVQLEFYNNSSNKRLRFYLIPTQNKTLITEFHNKASNNVSKNLKDSAETLSLSCHAFTHGVNEHFVLENSKPNFQMTTFGLVGLEILYKKYVGFSKGELSLIQTRSLEDNMREFTIQRADKEGDILGDKKRFQY